jgi:hypothetical protein
VFSLSQFSAARFGTTFFATRAEGRFISQLAAPGNTLNTCPVYPQLAVSLDTVAGVTLTFSFQSSWRTEPTR